ncbi:V8-like Glu-specific endopeptidase [Beutenbergia cavernae DSM 12333]|uniref:V8-like Glu-specific endopeptidase n=1 Tax=Beutenbergia cavernae (strain ATCC BAA-8 / DSM 12333 / CCUG 43141 / JCM 11478 / NBRC 16432 / NCIMB 13614 / HKI 0122) TaxID=471853 RepID=C5C5X2_BEUC1|nr:hypothetical protein [Beutenbergia cavernae]ACQ82330.1 V8-like Glu-specific endopeptidase [Beutenbergia cavernae DSM 12333]
MTHLVLVHGRGQAGLDSIGLKADWVGALAGSGPLPITEELIHFPYYGDTLAQLTAGMSPREAAAVIVRGDDVDDGEKAFMLDVMREWQLAVGLSDDEVVEASDEPEVIERGFGDWPWVRAVLRAIDQHLPGGSAATIALVTHDVYRYLTDSAIRETIDDGVASAMPDGEPTIVVGHSLGSVVAYHVLRSHVKADSWDVPLLVTVGSPLAVTAIRATLKRLDPIRVPDPVGSWLNARDPRDVVALYPLTADRFPLPSSSRVQITDDSTIDNVTPNRHGISGYFAAPGVAKPILDALR